ncbi:MAG: hypothetical protein AAF658_02975, partial [Myxococcota bacterium]
MRLSNLATALLLTLAASPAWAQLNPRVNVNQRGRALFLPNSVVTCDRTRESAADCDTVELTSGGPNTFNNDHDGDPDPGIITDWIDVDDPTGIGD